jgi:hypothetical protein
VNRRKLTPPNIVILAGGAVMLIGSFMAFYEYKIGGVSAGTANAWDHGLFMITTLPALLGAFMALQVALQAFSNIDMPPRLLGLTWDQVHVVLSFQATLLLLAHLLRARLSFAGLQQTFGVGFWLMLLASIALVVAALMRVASTGRRPRLL